MSFGFSISDIITGYTLASEIYYRCFTKAQGANVKYHQFGRDINLLGDNLKRLESINNNAEVQRPYRPWRNKADQLGSNTLQEVTGDFISTLQDCQALLEDNSKFHRCSANFIDNIIWWTGCERDVVALRERVHFHLTKVAFIAKPFETQLLLGIRRELQQLRRDVADLKGVLVQTVRQDDGHFDPISTQPSSVPEDLALRFLDALYVNKPKSFDTLGHLPLKEAFDALVYNFANSTVEFNPGLGLGLNIPEEPQYLNLIKSRWIAIQIEESFRFRSAGPDSLWADYLRELRDDIREQFIRFESGSLVSPSHDVLLRLPDSCFGIWVVEQPEVPPPDLAEQRPFEEKILETVLPSSYGNRQCALTIFRKSDVEFRLVSTTKDERNQHFHREESMDINMNLTRLIPAYASPDATARPTHNMMLYSTEAQNPKWYTFKDANDITRFQQALTGYRVFHGMSNVAWSIEGSTNAHKSGKGVLQLWQFKSLPRVSCEPEASSEKRTSSQNTSPQSPPMGTSKLKRESTAMTGVTLVSRSSITSSVIGSRGAEGTALMRPETPVLVIFTTCERKYAYLHIRLDRAVSVKPGLCACRKLQNSCRRVVLAGTPGLAKTIDIRRHRADQEFEKGLNSWDLARLRYPQHAKFKNLELLKKKEYFCLDFSSTEEKDEFLHELSLLEYLRNLDRKDYDQSLQEKQYYANNPGKRRGS
ncbi:hypothetical protein ACLMJK_006153 [Lecanora helva]